MSRDVPLRHEGFTLIEALLVIAVIAVLLSLAAPSFVTFSAGQKVKTASFEMYATMSFARSEALKRRAAVTVTPVSSDWTKGWTVTTPDPASAATLTLRTQEALSGIITVATNCTSTTDPLQVVYRADGRVTGPLCVLIQPQSGDLSAVNPNRCLQVNFTGLPKTTQTDSTVCP